MRRLANALTALTLLFVCALLYSLWGPYGVAFFVSTSLVITAEAQ